MKNLRNAALNWQPFVTTISTRQMFLHKFIHQGRVKKRRYWKNVLSLRTYSWVTNTFYIFTFFFKMEKGTQSSITNLEFPRGSWKLGRRCFQCLGVAPFWLLERVCTLFPRMLVFGKYFMVVKNLKRKD